MPTCPSNVFPKTNSHSFSFISPMIRQPYAALYNTGDTWIIDVLRRRITQWPLLCFSKDSLPNIALRRFTHLNEIEFDYSCRIIPRFTSLPRNLTALYIRGPISLSVMQDSINLPRSLKHLCLRYILYESSALEMFFLHLPLGLLSLKASCGDSFDHCLESISNLSHLTTLVLNLQKPILCPSKHGCKQVPHRCIWSLASHTKGVSSWVD